MDPYHDADGKFGSKGGSTAGAAAKALGAKRAAAVESPGNADVIAHQGPSKEAHGLTSALAHEAPAAMRNSNAAVKYAAGGNGSAAAISHDEAARRHLAAAPASSNPGAHEAAAAAHKKAAHDMRVLSTPSSEGERGKALAAAKAKIKLDAGAKPTKAGAERGAAAAKALQRILANLR